MALQVQRAVLSLVADCVDGSLHLSGVTPPWLKRPGPVECGARWSSVTAIYRRLTGAELPEEMPPRERRTVDAVLEMAHGLCIVEVDESQHFTPSRALTLEMYPSDVLTSFDRGMWHERSLGGRRPPGGGFARPCPPLFPDPGGRHLQRAFRDALADLLPAEHGWRPTLRIADWEVAGWLASHEAVERMGGLLAAKAGLSAG